jgi:hypothetical protein
MKIICNFAATMLAGAAVVINLNTGSLIVSVILGLVAYYLAEQAKRSLGLTHLPLREMEDPGVESYFRSGSLAEECRRNGAGA